MGEPFDGTKQLRAPRALLLSDLAGLNLWNVSSIEVSLFDPEIKLLDSSVPLEVGSSSGIAVQNESTLRGVDDPNTCITCSADCLEWSTRFSDLIQNFRIFPHWPLLAVSLGPCLEVFLHWPTHGAALFDPGDSSITTWGHRWRCDTFCGS